MDYLLPIAYWSLLPQLGAKLLQSCYYKTWKNPPQPNTPEWVNDNRKCYLVCVSGYLVYSLLQIEWDQAANLYQKLLLYPTADDKALRTAFRQLSLVYHPDKLAGDPGAEKRFLDIRNAYEVLKDPLARSAYNVFGLSSLSCEKCMLFKDYFFFHISSVLAFYSVTFITGVAFAMMGSLSFAPYWRLVTFMALGSFEMATLSSGRDPIPFLLHWRTPSEKIHMARQLFVLFSIAFNVIGPFFFPQDNRSSSELVAELELLVLKEGEAATTHLKESFAPFVADGQVDKSMKTNLEKWFIERTLEADPEFRLALRDLKT
ncbi:hypothetical protein HDV03_000341 [Kappamyces sp. JEL0829]|nr:hypothetical protein HDV03_000341 [Kappamyces sp. JEL0829]